MLKFIKHHMETIAGIEIFPLSSLIIFFVFFTLLAVFVFKADKKSMDTLANIPLDSTTTDEDNENS